MKTMLQKLDIIMDCRLFLKFHLALLSVSILHFARGLDEIKPTPQPNVKCVNYDIVFAIDGSRSIKRHNFEKIRDFLKYIVKHGEVSGERNHFGLLQFSEEFNTTVEFGFNFKQERNAILSRLQSVRYHKGRSTFAGAGLKIVLDSIFTQDGKDNSRWDARKLLVILTDGKSHDSKKAKKYASMLKNRGVRILVVAAGVKIKGHFRDLVQLASNQQDMWNTSFVNLPNTARKFAQVVTDGNCFGTTIPHLPTEVPSKQSTTPQLKDTIGSTKTPPPVPGRSTTPTPNLPVNIGPEQPTTEKLENFKMSTAPADTTTENNNCLNWDVFFAIDGSRSIKRHNFEKIRDFLKYVIKHGEVSGDRNHFGLLQFSEEFRTTLEFGFNFKQERNAILSRLQSVRYHKGRSTFAGAGLKMVLDSIFTQNGKDNSRWDASKLLVILTDGKSHDSKKAKKYASMLKNRGVRILVVAAGVKIKGHFRDLIQLASNQQDMWNTSFVNLPNTARKFAQVVTDGNCFGTTIPHLPTEAPSKQSTTPQLTDTIGSTKIPPPVPGRSTTPTPNLLVNIGPEQPTTEKLENFKLSTSHSIPLNTMSPLTHINSDEILTTIPAYGPTENNNCLNWDVFFAIDGSRSIKRHNFEKIRDFLKHIIKHGKVSGERNHFGLLQFSEEFSTSVEFGFNFKQERNAILSRLQSVRYHKGRSTFAGAGLKMVLDSIFTQSGKDNSRWDAGKLLVILTDGKSHDSKKAKKYASMLKNRGVRILVVAAGVKIKEHFRDLIQLASNQQDVWNTSFVDLPDTARKFVKFLQRNCSPLRRSSTSASGPQFLTNNEMSGVVRPTTLSTSPESSVISSKYPRTLKITTENTSTKSAKMFPSQETTSAPKSTLSSLGEEEIAPGTRKSKCSKWDVFFAIDGSRSIKRHNFEKIRDFLKYVIKHGEVSGERNHFGLLQFSEEFNTTVEFGFNFKQEGNAILSRLQSVRYHKGRSTFAGAGLKMVLDSGFAERGNDNSRWNAKKLLVILTDGKSHDSKKAKKYASMLKNRDVRILVVAAGVKIKGHFRDLFQLASNQQDMWNTSFVNLPTMARKLVHVLVDCVKTVNLTNTLTQFATSTTKEAVGKPPRPDATQPQVTQAPSTLTRPFLPITRSLLKTERKPSLNSHKAEKEKLNLKQCTKRENHDIFFVVDGSRSITRHNFEKIREFLRNFIINGEVSAERNHVGLLQFSEEFNTTVEFGFDFKQERNAILSRLQSVRYHEGRPITGAAMKIVLDSVFTGNDGNRADAGNILIVLTDGEAHDLKEAVEYSSILKQDRGVRIIVIGLGQKVAGNIDKLNVIASSQEDVLLVSFSNLLLLVKRFVKSFVGQICHKATSINQTSVRVGNNQIQTRGPQFLENNEVKTERLHSDLEKSANCEEVQDIVFVVDGSWGTTKRGFNAVKDFMKGLVRSLDVRPGGTHVAIVQYSQTTMAALEWSFEDSQRKEDVLNQISRINYQDGRATFTGEALLGVAQMIFAGDHGDRSEGKDIVVLITYSYAHDPWLARSVATKLRSRGVHIIVVGVAQNIHHTFVEELRTLASVPEEVLTTSFHNLSAIAGKLLGKLCPVTNAVALNEKSLNRNPDVRKQNTRATAASDRAAMSTKHAVTTSVSSMNVQSTIIPPKTSRLRTTILLATIVPDQTIIPPTPNVHRQTAPSTSPTTNATVNTTLPTTLPPTTEQRACSINQSKDVLFAVDSSSNIPPFQFKKVKRFIQYAISELHRRDNNVLVGMMQFSDTANMLMQFTNVSDEIVDTSMSKMRRQNRLERNTGELLDKGSKEFYKVNTAYKRYINQDIIILITSGRTNDRKKLKLEVEILKARNIKLILIAVGRERRTLSTEWSQLINPFYVFIGKLKFAEKLFEDLWEPLCSQDYRRETNLPSSFVCERRPRDVFFVVDGSASINVKNFNNIRKLLQDLIILLTRQNIDLHIGLMQFSEAPKTKILLKLGQNPTEHVIDTVQSMEYQMGRRTDTGDALSRVNSEVFTKYHGDRPLVDDIVILLTDGSAHDFRLARPVAQQMRNRNIKIIGIAAGSNEQVNKFKHELQRLVSNPEDIITTDFKNLASFVTKLLKITCDQ